ncbi:hypothetical protein DE146DRAFT_344940 [Phaeosphaeria sp. MPI-PUGE-AT-0046c]|nr:hypothetical protein DE146DRAFT_344940 [Phaeosphaeria sp. MPI-PUGE-AT-0046c]
MISVITVLLFLIMLVIANAFPTTTSTPASAPPSSTTGIWSPIWLDAATYSLICYDAFVMGLLCWLWLCGHLAWLKQDQSTVLRQDVEMETRMRDGRGRGTMIEGEMRRLGIF